MEHTITKKLVQAEVISNKEICPEHFVMTLEAPELIEGIEPGQFVNIKVSDNPVEHLLRIPLGIHFVKDTKMGLLYKVVGSGTKILSKKTSGESINVLGPLGRGFKINKNTDALIVSGGHGIAPLFAVNPGKPMQDLRPLELIPESLDEFRSPGQAPLAFDITLTETDGDIVH